MKNSKIDRQIIFIVLLLSAIGLAMVFSVSAISRIDTGQIAYGKFFKQLFRVFVGLVVMFAVSKIPLSVLKTKRALILLTAIGTLILVLIAGSTVNGSKRWLNVGFSYIQPVEFVYIALVIFIASWLDENSQYLNSFADGLLRVLVIPFVIVILLMIQPDFSAAFIVLMLTFIMLYLSPIKAEHLFSIVAVGVLFLLIFILIGDYRMDRITGFLTSRTRPFGDQTSQSLIALGSGGVTGVGYAASKMKLFFLQAADTDYILAIIGEEFGFMGLSVLFVLFFMLFLKLLRIANRSAGTFEYYLASGLISILLLHYIINVSVVLKLFPVTGIPLPFISYGGSHILAEFTIVGLLINLAGKVDHERRFV